MILMIGMFFISMASAYDLGTVKQNTCIDLYQWCNDCTYVNVTSVQLANKTITYLNVAMTENGYDYTYNYCNNSLLGDYFYTVCSDTSATNKCATFSYGVTGTGQEFSLQRMWLSLGMLGLVVLLFITNLIVIPLLPNKDNTDEEGTLISINKLKYIRPILYVTAYLLLMSIIFIGSNLSLAYLGTTLLGNLLYKIFYIMAAIMPLMLVLWFIYIFYNIFQDKQMKDYIERGIIGEKIPDGRFEW